MTQLSGTDLCYCLAVRRSARHMTRLYDRNLAGANISISQFSILAKVHERPGISIAELAEAMVMERTTLVRALKPLQTEGLVDSRAEGPRSALSLSLSASGLSKISECEPLWEAAQKEYEAQIGRDRAASIRESLKLDVDGR